jgi:hypothetical protein
MRKKLENGWFGYFENLGRDGSLPSYLCVVAWEEERKENPHKSISE